MSEAPPSLDVFGPAIRFGAGVVEQAGAEATRLGWERVLLVTDAGVLAAGVPDAVSRSLAGSGVWSETLAAPLGEPRDDVLGDMAGAAANGVFDGAFAVGGGAALDTAKLLVLLLASPGRRLLDYVNPPFGRGLEPPPGMLPIIAVPTTAGSGSEVSGVAVVDLVAEGSKTAVSHAALRPRLALADPATTLSVPARATAAAGLDVLAHALESLTARPHDAGGRAPGVYNGRNPYSDALCAQALPLLVLSLPAAVRDGDDLGTRTDVMLAATLANLGAAAAGAHAGHALAYAVAARGGESGDERGGMRGGERGGMRGDERGRVRGDERGGVRGGPARVSHGFAVALALPGLLREIERIDPDRHRFLATLLGGPPAAAVERLLDDCEVDRLPAYGFTPEMGAALAGEAMTQRRLIANAPAGLDTEALARIADAMLAPAAPR